MSRWGISGAAVPSHLPYAAAVNTAATAQNFPPCFAYAIFWRETIRGERAGWWNAATVISPDGGYGLGQPTPSASGIPLPSNWQDPETNALHCIKQMVGIVSDLAAENLRGDSLIKMVADSYNAGEGNAEAGHRHGNADMYTTGSNYGSDVLSVYHNLIAGKDPDAK